MKEYMDKEEGKKEGMKAGEFNALVYSLEDLIHTKYKREAPWLRTCTIEKLQGLMKVILSNINYEELYELATH